MNRIGGIAAMLVVACGWILAQENTAVPPKAEHPGAHSRPASGKAARQEQAERKHEQASPHPVRADARSLPPPELRSVGDPRSATSGGLNQPAASVGPAPGAPS